MGLFVTSTSNVDRHGIFAFEVPPPASIAAAGTGTALIAGQFPWGPDGEVLTPESPAEMFDKLCPRGMARTGSGPMALMRKKWPLLKAIRILGSAAAKATAVINKTGPTALITITLKYKGVAGNSVIITIRAATDGDANHFDIVATVTLGTQSTTDIIQNYNVSGVGTQSSLTQTELDRLKLIGSIAHNSTGVPILGNTTCSTGADGTIAAAQYLGTAGTGDLGLALAEGDEDIQHVFTDDPGNTIRAAVNAGVVAHVALMGDRTGYINGNSGLTAAQSVTDVASYRSTGIVYMDPWVYVEDEDGTERLLPSNSFAASVASQLSPSTSIAWKATVVSNMLVGIKRLEANRGSTAIGTNTKQGIVTIIPRKKGGWAFEADNITNAPVNDSTRTLRRTRMGHYIAKSVVDSLTEFGDAPNVAVNQQSIVNAVDEFLSKLKRAKNENPNITPHIENYDMKDIESENTDASLSGGDFNLPTDIKTSSAMERIFFRMRWGETVKISVT